MAAGDSRHRLQSELRIVFDLCGTLRKPFDEFFEDGGHQSSKLVGLIMDCVGRVIAQILLLRQERDGVMAELFFEREDRNYFDCAPEAVEHLVQHWTRLSQAGTTRLSESEVRSIVTKSIAHWPRKPVPKPPHPHLRLVT